MSYDEVAEKIYGLCCICGVAYIESESGHRDGSEAQRCFGRSEHVVQDYVAAHGTQFPAHSKVGQREIEQMTSVHENNVKRSAGSAR
jgi:hypothetical protein